MEKVAVPRRWRDEIARVLVTEKRLAARVRDLGMRIEKDFAGRDLVLVAILSGTVVFLADLLRQLRLPLHLDFMAVSSYGNSTSSRPLVVTKDLRLDVAGRDVLLVEDIVDSGKTLHHILSRIRELKPRQIRTCVLLDKPARRVKQVPLDYVGFRIPDEFVVGYGLDFAERYRNLPFIGVLHPSLYLTSPASSNAAAQSSQKAKRKVTG